MGTDQTSAEIELMVIWPSDARRDQLIASLLGHDSRISLVYVGTSIEAALNTPSSTAKRVAIIGQNGSELQLNIGPLLTAGIPAFGIGTSESFLESRELSTLRYSLNVMLEVETTPMNRSANGQSSNAHLVRLGAREREAFHLYGNGMTLKQVADEMDISFSTAATYIKRVRQKFERAGHPLRNKVDFFRILSESPADSFV